MKTITLKLTEERLRELRDVIKIYADIDSLDEIEILVKVESIFGIHIPDYGSDEWNKE